MGKRFALIRQHGPILQPQTLQDTKDPCPIFDGRQWHMFGSVGSSTVERWHIFHAVSPKIEGPWQELLPSELIGVTGDHVAAPGLCWDGAWLHMFVQTDHAALGGTIEHLVSDDQGRTFTWLDTALTSQHDIGEATIYDPHPAEINWHGSAQCNVLSSESGEGHSQRVFFAVGDSPVGPYTSLGPVLEPSLDTAPWESGENGHASAFVADHKLLLFYQARGKEADTRWRYGVAEFGIQYDEHAA